MVTMRHGLLREAVTGRYQRHGSVEHADCVIGFSFGYRVERGRSVPGASNLALARVVAERHLRLPLILQWEIAAALPTMPRQLWRIERHVKPKQYLDSREVARQASEIMRQEGYATALIVAHPHHVGRADAVCQRLGLRTVVSEGLDGVGFDPESDQPWIRSQPVWSVRETMALAYYDAVAWL